MRKLKTHPIIGLQNSYLVDSPQPANINYIWNLGSLLGLSLIIQIVSGVTLAIHYAGTAELAFLSVEHIIRDVKYGWLLRYLHANTASLFFISIYIHVGRGLYYGSYRSPRVLAWSLGVLIIILIIATAFLGYVLVYGQISLWGATVITNLLSAIPWLGKSLVETVWGGFSVSNATLNRFYSLHYLLPFILAALTALHLLSLHSNGSNNPNGISGNADRLPFHPYFSFKDLVTVFVYLLILSILVFFYPNILGDSDNYTPANPIATPPAIVPEWYLLPFYAILRSIPNKLIGVIAIFASLIILFAIPILDISPIRGAQFRPLYKLSFWFFIANFSVLFVTGQEHVEQPWILIGQLCTIVYFGFFAVQPLIAIVESSLFFIGNEKWLSCFDLKKLQKC